MFPPKHSLESHSILRTSDLCPCLHAITVVHALSIIACSCPCLVRGCTQLSMLCPGLHAVIVVNALFIVACSCSCCVHACMQLSIYLVHACMQSSMPCVCLHAVAHVVSMLARSWALHTMQFYIRNLPPTAIHVTHHTNLYRTSRSEIISTRSMLKKMCT